MERERERAYSPARMEKRIRMKDANQGGGGGQKNEQEGSEERNALWKKYLLKRKHRQGREEERV